MSDRSSFIEGVIEQLKNSLGTKEQRMVALNAAVEMEALLPAGSPKADFSAETLRRVFRLWVHRMNYLATPTSLDHHLPETINRSDAEVAREYGLHSQKATDEKQIQIEQAAQTRVGRAIHHMDAGWCLEDVMCFVSSKEEWRRVMAKARRTAA